MRDWKVVGTAVTFGKVNMEPVNRLKQMGCEVLTNGFGRPFTPEEFVKIAGDADAIIVGNDKVPESVIRQLKNLKIIAKHGVGTDSIDIKTANELGIVVTNAPGTNSQEVADLAFGMIHTIARWLHIVNYTTKDGQWYKPMGMSLYNKTIGIIGVGKIGTATAKRAAGYDMNILGYDLVERPEAKALGVNYTGLDELISKSDIVSLHVPLTEKTRNILNRDRFKVFKKGAILINTARSQLLDNDSLYTALTDGTLRGYAADVYDYEPPSPKPFFGLDNVVLTPHIGGTCVESNLRMGNTAVDNVIAVMEGRVPPNLVLPDTQQEE
jgi:D-3-phosphoglycerate dehydrogenase